MTIYGHSELNIHTYEHPSTLISIYTRCIKLIQVFGGVRGAMGGYGHQYVTVGGRESPGVHITTHAYIYSYSPPYPPIHHQTFL